VQRSARACGGEPCPAPGGYPVRGSAPRACGPAARRRVQWMPPCSFYRDSARAQVAHVGGRGPSLSARCGARLVHWRAAGLPAARHGICRIGPWIVRS
jgi:hypothetical protein